MEFGVDMEDENIGSSPSQNQIRVVLTSSISTLTAKDSNGGWKQVVDEFSRTHVDHVWKTKASGWVYTLSKLLTEEEAFKFAVENGVDLVSVITATVAGPFLTTNVPSSIQVLLSPLTNICKAHIFLMEHEKADGRYICSAQNCPLAKLLNHLAQEYPSSNLQRFLGEDLNQAPSEISSKKLKDLGFKYKHGVQDIIHETVTGCVGYGFLHPIGS
ncbi:hypothetical protein TIFTF001_021221 [Ficus carica]|uniref:Uncharacterized protein n=1 Tax=Ficus carica TaxID=3494 RepID=A0AA88AYP7_FICCA|nr:hypothetical protein TIFTF001_021221 [Ficus carica]